MVLPCKGFLRAKVKEKPSRTLRGFCRDGLLPLTPYSKTPLFSGYHVDPLLKKDVFTMENQVFPKIS